MNLIQGVQLEQSFLFLFFFYFSSVPVLHVVRCFSDNTPDSNDWVVIRFQQSFMMNPSFESGVLSRETAKKRLAKLTDRIL